MPPPVQEMHDCLAALEVFLHDATVPPLAAIALAHYQFEAIHPFLDGNGRVGRLLITLFLIEREILPAPLLYLSAFSEATRQEYYDRLRAVTDRAEWEPWLEYFLNGVARQGDDAVDRAGAINEKLNEWRMLVAGASSTVPGALVDLLASNPYWTVKGVAAELGVAFTTAKRAVDKLLGHSVLVEVSGGKRDRVYCAREILDVLEAPARLTG